MSRQESEREDLLREATALVERVELRLPEQPESIVAGFRRDGSASFFFGQSPVYQFNSRRELRRAYVGGLLYKTDNGQLVEMRRERTATAVELHSRVLTDEETASFVLDAEDWIGGLRNAMNAGKADVLGQVPIEKDVAARVTVWLQELPAKIVLANTSRL
ncbi:MAG: hypothetical protein IAF94_04445 [Pirellulaceae bacterium]|nr:hypothetical protein [Pirellulaceae bacterium]